MTVITQEPEIEKATTAALERIPTEPLVREKLVAIKPNDTWACPEDSGGIIQSTKPTLRLFSIAFLGLLFLYPVFQAVYHLTLPRRSQEVRPLISQLKEHYRDGETLYIHPATHYTFSYYADREHLDNMKPIFGTWIGARSWASYVINEIDKVRGRKRVWFLFSGRTDSGGLNHEDLSVAHLNRVGKKLQVFQSKGASVYLYDLRDEE